MPTVAEILAGIDSFVTPAKRRVVDMLMNPRAAMAQTAGRLSDDSNAALRDLNTQADANMLRAQGSVMADLPQYRQAEDASRQRIVNMLMNFAPVGATVWHGSPYKFDKFDSSKIGKGEGAQTYGMGHYTGSTKEVGEWYKKSLGEVYGAMNAEPRSALQEAIQQKLKRGMKEIGGVPDKATAMDWINGHEELLPHSNATFGSIQDAYERLVRRGDPGYLYKINLPDEAIAKMLDWDKGGAAIWNEAVKKTGGPKEAAEMLRAQGIPGIRYLDGGSRGAGQGTSNYVVFPGNENLLNILERNGKPIK